VISLSQPHCTEPHETTLGCISNEAYCCRSLNSLVAIARDYCPVFYELLYSVMKELVNGNNEG
jgi:hypothetical protein